MRKTTQTLVLCGLFAALIAVFTAFLKVPSPLGYVHLGDGMIFAAAALLGPLAGLVAGIGSALADVIAGYPLYVLPTFLIKGAMGLVSGWLLLRPRMGKLPGALAIFALCELLMIAGYFIAEAYPLSYGVAGAWSAVPYNVAQGMFGILMGALLLPLVRKIKT